MTLPILRRSLWIAAVALFFAGGLYLLGDGSAIRRPASTGNSATGIPGFAEYQLTSLRDEGEVKELYSWLRTDLDHAPWDACSDRAHVWSWQMFRTRAVRSGKIFLFYTVSEIPDTRYASGKRIKVNATNPAGRNWIWHVAPYVVADGKMWVMEKFKYMDQPMLLEDWLRKQANGAQCVEQVGADPEFSKWICGGADGKCTQPTRMVRVPEGGAPCYFRRVPMYYYYPSSIGHRDHLQLPERQDWVNGDVYSACYNSLTGMGLARKKRCSKFVSNPMASFTSDWVTPSDAPGILPLDGAGETIPPEVKPVTGAEAMLIR